MDEPGAAKRPSVLTIDRAAFLLLRVKRAFKKKRQQRKEKQGPEHTTTLLRYQLVPTNPKPGVLANSSLQPSDVLRQSLTTATD